MATVNVARLYNFHDRGLLAEGRRADIILIEKDGYNLRIKQTWLKGRLVYNELVDA